MRKSAGTEGREAWLFLQEDLIVWLRQGYAQPRQAPLVEVQKWESEKEERPGGSISPPHRETALDVQLRRKNEGRHEYHDRLKAELWRVDKLKEKQKRKWDEAALRWLDDRKRGSEDTLVGILRWLQPHLRGKVFQDITPSVIEDIMRRKRKEEVSPSTVNKYLTLIPAVLRFTHGLGWMEGIPRVRTIPTDDRRIRFLTHAEAARLLKELPEHQRDLAQIALLTGLRQRKILELSWDQIDIDRRLEWIHPEQAKGRKAIGIPLVPEALAILRKNEENHPERVFTLGPEESGDHRLPLA